LSERRENTMSKINVPFTNLESAIKTLGSEEVYNCLLTGYKAKVYRKEYNVAKQGTLDLVKNSPEIQKILQANLKARSK